MTRTTKYLLTIATILTFSYTHSFQGWRMNKKTITSSALSASESSSKGRVPWEFGRFIQQSSQFVTLPMTPKKNSLTISPGDTLWEASGSKSNLFSWSVLDDVVMGGASSSTFDNETGLWRGTVTTANNGGFIGVRSKPFQKSLDMSNCSGIEISLRGCDKNMRVKGMLRDTTDFNGITWSTSFDVPMKKTAKVRVPFQKLIPTRFARKVEGQDLKKDYIVGVQLVYSKFEYDGGLNPKFAEGDFSLQVVEIKAY